MLRATVKKKMSRVNYKSLKYVVSLEQIYFVELMQMDEMCLVMGGAWVCGSKDGRIGVLMCVVDGTLVVSVIVVVVGCVVDGTLVVRRSVVVVGSVVVKALVVSV